MTRIISSACTHFCICQLISVLTLRANEFVLMKISLVSSCGTIPYYTGCPGGNVLYVKVHRYNPKHLYPKLNGYGDNGERSLKV